MIGILLKVIKVLLADLLFWIGNKLVIWSALLSGKPDIARNLKNIKPQWLKTEED
jgi:hypothetical protein